MNDREGGDLRDVSQARKLLQCVLGFKRKAVQLSHHQLDDIIGVFLGVDAIQIPGPSRTPVIEGEQALLVELGNKLNGKERVSASLVVDQAGQRGGLRLRAVKSICQQLFQTFMSQRRKDDLLHVRSGLAYCFDLAHEWMVAIHFVVAKGADQHQLPHIGPGEQILKQIERRGIEPLQVIEEEREGMFRVGEYADKSPKYQLKTTLRILWGEIRDWRLLPYDELQFGTRSTMS